MPVKSYIGLVCDGVVIDQLTCSNTLDAAVADINALNNGGLKNHRYVVMQSPCSPKLPDGCQPVPEPAPLVDSENDIGADDAVSSLEEMPAGLPADQIALWKKKHHHCPRCHKNHDGPCNQGGGSGSQHPYEDLCVAVGEFCGNQLFGCDFIKTSLYRCDQIGKPPFRIPDDKNRCGGTGPPGTCVCPGDGNQPVCGYQLHLSCNADPQTIYYCPNGNSSTPVPTKSCSGINECVSAPGGALCNVKSECTCTSTGTVCGKEFPETCSVPTEGVFQCTKGGAPEPQQDCQLTGGICVGVKEVPATSAQNVFTAAAAKCQASCTCTGYDDVCASSLPYECGFAAETDLAAPQ
ncbi:hypothetical protein DFQ27_008775 [Actinomortierella ambigua]|uniref:Uncharacterized protein n=1 Tax=Actinomortierella ambigua TaxID=1343610 RepID=A0A9P6PPR6_9FUNG|nr:hypothetical protein DFQ27_008775 [Actinomortierella ambigua]